MQTNVRDIISAILWTMLTGGVAIALTLSVVAYREASATPDSLAVDCYSLMAAVFETVEDSEEEDAAYDVLFDRGCWP